MGNSSNKKVKHRKEAEVKEAQRNETSRRIGAVSSSILLITIICDLTQGILKMESLNTDFVVKCVDTVFGILALIVIVLLFNGTWYSKFRKNKKSLDLIFTFYTIIACYMYVVEKTILPLTISRFDNIIAYGIIGIFFIAIIIFPILIIKKRDWNYNEE